MDADRGRLQGHWTLPRTTMAPALARELVETRAGPALSADALCDVLLMTSELVTNAVAHATGAITLDVELVDEAIRVAVCDDNPSPALPAQRGPLDLGGRGLKIVAALASTWASEPTTSGKRVWFAAPTGSPLAPR